MGSAAHLRNASWLALWLGSWSSYVAGDLCCHADGARMIRWLRLWYWAWRSQLSYDFVEAMARWYDVPVLPRPFWPWQRYLAKRRLRAAVKDKLMNVPFAGNIRPITASDDEWREHLMRNLT